jgi:hypothetical protein
VLIAPATAVQTFVRERGTRASVHLQGVTIDVGANLRREEAGARTRARLGIASDRVVIAYVGKFKGIYYSEAEYVQFIQRSCAADPVVHHLIITHPEHVADLEATPGFSEVRHRCTLHGPVEPDVLPDLLSAADLGVVAVPPTPAQVYRSPVKTALYWAAGLPVLIPKGVSDDWWIARDRRVGIVVDDLPTIDPATFLSDWHELIHDGIPEMRSRCVQAAWELRDTGLMARLLREAISGEG